MLWSLYWIDLDMIYVDCCLFEQNKNYGFRQYIYHMLSVYGNEKKNIQNKFKFIFKASSKDFLELEFGESLIKRCIFINDKFWRIRLIFLRLEKTKSKNLILNTYNQGFYFFYLNNAFTIVHDHQFLTRFHKKGLRKLYFKILFKLLYRNRFICISKTTMYEHIKYFSNPNVVNYLYNPLDEVIYEDQKSKSTMKHMNYFLYIGSGAEYKNVNYLLSEYKKYIQSGGLSELVCVGAPEIQSELSSYFYKNISQQELNILYKNSKCIVLPSMYEGYCYPYVEARIFKKHTIVYDMPISREMLNAKTTTFIHCKPGELALSLNALDAHSGQNKVNNKLISLEQICSPKYFSKLIKIMGL